MRANGLLLLFFLLIIVSLSACLTNQRYPLNLSINIDCSEYIADSFDENDWSGSSSGSIIIFDGKIDYDSSTASELKKVIARINVHGESGLQFQDEITIQLHPTGTSVFQEAVNFEDSGLSCAEHKYSLAFYSPEGNIVLHNGDLENSIINPVHFYNTTSPNHETLFLTALAKPDAKITPTP